MLFAEQKLLLLPGPQYSCNCMHQNNLFQAEWLGTFVDMELCKVSVIEGIDLHLAENPS